MGSLSTKRYGEMPDTYGKMPDTCKDILNTSKHSQDLQKEIIDVIVRKYGYDLDSISVQWKTPSEGNIQKSECVIESRETIPNFFFEDRKTGDEAWRIEKVSTATIFSVSRIRNEAFDDITYHDAICEFNTMQERAKPPDNKEAPPLTDGSKAKMAPNMHKHEEENLTVNDESFDSLECLEKEPGGGDVGDARRNNISRPKKHLRLRHLKSDSIQSSIHISHSKCSSVRCIPSTDTLHDDLFLTPKSSSIAVESEEQFSSCLSIIGPSSPSVHNVNIPNPLSYAEHHMEAPFNGVFTKPLRSMDPNVGLVGFLPELTPVLKGGICTEWAQRHLNASRKGLVGLTGAISIGGLNPLVLKDPSLGGSLMHYDPNKYSWELIGTLPEPRHYHACAFHRNQLYLVGGYCPFLRKRGETLATPTTYCMDVRSGAWSRGPDLNHARACHGMALVKGRIYVVGGRDAQGEVLSSMEVLVGRGWLLKDNLPYPVMGCAVSGTSDALWLVGGVSKMGRFLNSVMSFSPSEERWTRITPLPLPRAFAAAVWRQGKLWVVGGCVTPSGGPRPKSMGNISVYHPQGRSWETRPLLLEPPRHALGMCSLGDCLLIVGGIVSQQLSATSTAEILDGSTFEKMASYPSPVAGSSLLEIPCYQ